MNTSSIRVAYGALLGAVLAVAVGFGVNVFAAGPRPPQPAGITFTGLSGTPTPQESDRQTKQIDSFYSAAQTYREQYPTFQRNVFIWYAALGLAVAVMGVALPAVVRDVPAGHRLRLTVATTDLAYQVPTDARAYTVDVADRASVEDGVAATLRELGRLDILVNNAGVSHVGPHTQDVTDDEWFQSINVMQTGVFFCTRAVSQTLLGQRSGSVVNISSIRGFSPNPGRLAYCAPKAAVLMMTQVTAAEWAGHGVRVNAISPGVHPDVGRRRRARRDRQRLLRQPRPDEAPRRAARGRRARRLPLL